MNIGTSLSYVQLRADSKKMQSYLTFSSNYFVLSHFGAKLNNFGQKWDFKENFNEDICHGIVG